MNQPWCVPDGLDPANPLEAVVRFIEGHERGTAQGLVIPLPAGGMEEAMIEGVRTMFGLPLCQRRDLKSSD